jgi:hypothetical protein
MVRAIERPRREVWTSLPVRSALALNGVWPWLGDWVMARQKREIDAMNARGTVE